MAGLVAQAKRLTGKRFRSRQLGSTERAAMSLARTHSFAGARDLAPVALDLRDQGLITDSRLGEFDEVFRGGLEQRREIEQQITGQSLPVTDFAVFRDGFWRVTFEPMVVAFEAADHIALIARGFRAFISNDELVKFALSYWEERGWDGSFLAEWWALKDELVKEGTTS